MSIDDGSIRSPKMQLSDIFIPAETAKKNGIITVKNYSASSTLGEPSLILNDWLYLGNRYHAKSREMLEQLQITHILNITATIPCSFPDIIQYAQIKVFDESTVKLYDYFEAAGCFIDLCNPLNYDISKEPNKRKRRILIHCAMGISRSATITISYLMSRQIILNKTEQKIVSHIQSNLESFDEEIESKINETNFNGNGWSPKIFENHRNNKDLTKRTRKISKKYEKTVSNHNNNDNDTKYHTLPLSTNDEKEIEQDIDNKITTNNEMEKGINDEICNGLTLGEAYLFVLERRNVICPNVGFCHQMEIWEKYVWDTNDTTLYQIPFFRPDLNEHDTTDNIPKSKNGKINNKKRQNNQNNPNDDDQQNYQCSEQCCHIL